MIAYSTSCSADPLLTVFWPPPAITTDGGTLSIPTRCESSLPSTSSESIGTAWTVAPVWPSGNEHSKLPVVLVLRSEPATFSDPSPQSVTTI